MLQLQTKIGCEKVKRLTELYSLKAYENTARSIRAGNMGWKSE